jgi:hypothetical protein
MKILYVANDRRAAELAAASLHAVAPDGAVTWAGSLDHARRWIDENRDVAVLIVEVESDDPSCASFISELRRSGMAAPVIAVSVPNPAPPLTALTAVADRIVTKAPSFLEDLPELVGHTLNTAPPTQPARPRLRLLYVGDAAQRSASEDLAVRSKSSRRFPDSARSSTAFLPRVDQVSRFSSTSCLSSTAIRAWRRLRS